MMEPTEAERRLIDAARKGEVADYSSEEPAENDPARGWEWGERRTINAETIYQLVTQSNPAWPVHAKGVQVKGARVKGLLDFGSAEMKVPLVLVCCYLDEDIILTDASARSITLTGTHLFGIQAALLAVDGSVSLDRGFHAKGEVRLVGAKIEGQLVCTLGIFENTLNADFLKVDSTFLNKGFSAKGEVSLVNAQIDSQLICGGGRFENGLNAAGLKVVDVFFNRGFNAKGDVSLVRAEISDQLICSGGTFENGLIAAGLKVGDVFLDQGFNAEGDVNLAIAEIAGELNCSGGTFEGNLNLMRAHAGAIADDPGSWPKADRLLIDGFEYALSTSPGVPRDARQRLNWIELGPKGPKDHFLPQPYEQLVKVLRAMGDEAGVRRVSIRKQWMLRKRGQLGFPARLWNWFLWLIVGYGYRPWFPLVWAVLVVVAGSFIFHPAGVLRAANPNVPAVASALVAPPQKPLAPSAEPKRPHPVLYSIDVFLPFADLQQKKGWQLDESNHYFPWYEGWYLFEELAGWVLTALLAAAATGLLKK
jgi:hypothetical protein